MVRLDCQRPHELGKLAGQQGILSLLPACSQCIAQLSQKLLSWMVR